MVSYFEARNVAPPDPDRVTLASHYALVLPEDRAARILDVGCGFGGTMLALRKRGYENVTGIELDDAGFANCRSLGLDVHQCDITETDIAALGKFDLIIMSHVLEHMPKDKMIGIVANIRGALAPGGAFFVAVPNAQSATGAYWAFEDFTHTFLFTSGSLYYVARMAGFDRVDFIDVDCTAGTSRLTAFVRRLLLKIYRTNRMFWNKVTRSSYHNESVPIFSYEIKALLRNDNDRR